MESGRVFRPRVSRETRLLLTTALLAAVALWTLARVRPASVSGTSTLVPPVLSTFTLAAQYDGLAAEVVRVQARLADVLVAVPTKTARPDGAPSGVAGLRMGPDLILAVGPVDGDLDVESGLTLVAADPVSGLALIRTLVAGRSGPPVPWVPPPRPSPRYLVATDLAGSNVGVRPVFAQAFERVSSAMWPDLWSIGSAVALEPGTILFTIDGEFVGFVLDDQGTRVVLPAATAVEEIARLGAQQNRAGGWLGIETLPLTPALAEATGAASGVVVAWVEPQSDVAAALTPGDVIDRWNNTPITSLRHWDVHARRVRAGETVRIGVHATDDRLEISTVAKAVQAESPTAPSTGPSARPLGLTLRRIALTGAEVTRIAPASAGAEAELRPGDVITRIGAISAPAPAQITQAFANVPLGTPLLVAVSRGPTHLVTTLEK